MYYRFNTYGHVVFNSEWSDITKHTNHPHIIYQDDGAIKESDGAKNILIFSLTEYKLIKKMDQLE